jgi:hypothetical protein
MKKLLISCLTIFFCLGVMAQTAELKINPEKNKVYRLKSVSEQTVSQTVNGIQQTTQSKVNYVLSMKMIDITPDFMVAEIRFDTLITNTNAMGQQINISSLVEGDLKSSKTGDIMSCIMNRLSKNAVYSKIDYSGKPLEIVNLKMLSDMVLKDTASITLTGAVAAALKSQIAEAVSDNSLKTMIGMFTWYLPGKQVKTGDKWVYTRQTNSGGMALEIVTTYRLDKISSDIANISAESVIRAAASAVPIQSGGATVTYDKLQGLSKSAIVLDVRTGLVVEDKGKTRISGDLGISAPGLSMQMPMDIISESTVTSLK